MNSFKRVLAFQIELEFGSVGFWGEGKPGYREKNLSEKGREPTTNSTHINSVDAGSWTRATLVGGDRSHHCAIPCSPRKLSVEREEVMCFWYNWSVFYQVLTCSKRLTLPSKVLSVWAHMKSWCLQGAKKDLSHRLGLVDFLDKWLCNLTCPMGKGTSKSSCT